MFRKLRNRLVLINAIITSIVLLIAFCTIYLVAQNSTDRRPLPPHESGFSQQEEHTFATQMKDERRASLNSLAMSLIVVGVVVEVSVILISLTIAEIAIRPVRETYEAQKNFIANASHEMKTPIAAISANLEVADIQDNRWITNVTTEVGTLARINQQLLTLANAESSQIDTDCTRKEVGVDALLQEVVDSFKFKSQKRKIEPQIIVKPKTAKVNLSASDLQQILSILIDNAIKYGQKKVNVQYSSNNVFLVENDGKTIPAEKISHVFDRFYQVDKTSNGSGLGLAIAKAVAERNGWKLTVASDDTTVFKLEVK